MPVLVIAASCLVIFGIIGILGVAAVHFERRQQVREESNSQQHVSETETKAV